MTKPLRYGVTMLTALAMITAHLDPFRRRLG